jgi:hypothetical protein
VPGGSGAASLHRCSADGSIQMQLIITARYTSAARFYGRISSHTYTGPTPPRCYITVTPPTTTTTTTATSKTFLKKKEGA